MQAHPRYVVRKLGRDDLSFAILDTERHEAIRHESEARAIEQCELFNSRPDLRAASGAWESTRRWDEWLVVDMESDVPTLLGVYVRTFGDHIHYLPENDSRESYAPEDCVYVVSRGVWEDAVGDFRRSIAKRHALHAAEGR